MLQISSDHIIRDTWVDGFNDHRNGYHKGAYLHLKKISHLLCLYQ